MNTVNSDEIEKMFNKKIINCSAVSLWKNKKRGTTQQGSMTIEKIYTIKNKLEAKNRILVFGLFL